MFGKLIFLFVTVAVAFFCFAVYAPPVPGDPSDDDDDETQPFRSKTPTNFHEACIMIGELRQDLNRKSKALKETYAVLAPAALSEYATQFLQKTDEALSREDMVKAINTTTERVDEEMSELLSRVVLVDGGSKMRNALVDVAGTYFVRCRYNLDSLEDEDVKALNVKLTRTPEIDEHIFCREMTFLHVKTWKTWSFARPFSIPLHMDTILEGLRLYKLADSADTVKAVRVLYDSQIKK